MKLKTLSLYRDFVDFLHRESHRAPKHVRIGDLLLTFKLVNTAELSSESKLTYAYLFFHREDVNGVQVPILSRQLGMSTEQTRSTLNELTSKNYIKLITTRKSADLSKLSYYYKIVDPSKFGMLGLVNELYQPEEE
jgi:hypothetical protein